MLALALISASLLMATMSPEPPTQGQGEPGEATIGRRHRAPERRRDFGRYLGRDVATGPRHLGHGVFGVGVAGGLPHLYRVELSLGLLDHLTIGATAHWLPGQPAPKWSPLGSIALWRGEWLEAGASYRQILHPPPRDDDDPETPGFQARTHYVLGGVTFSRTWYSAGVDVGVANLRLPDPSEPEPKDDQFVTRTQFAGGLHLRIGTRRFGVTLQTLWPEMSAEALVDLRFGLFEKRRRGGWLEP